MLQINTVADAVAESINQKLINGEICPGNKINIDSLARELGVSKTPVREALKKLENTGILQALPRVGWRVPQTTIQETKWIFEFQRMLDLGLLGKIYDFKLLPNREKCEHINEEIKACFINGHLDDVIKLNISFHMELIANADNERRNILRQPVKYRVSQQAVYFRIVVHQSFHRHAARLQYVNNHFGMTACSV